jgi:mono/diheme cytochrome c family protein
MRIFSRLGLALAAALSLAPSSALSPALGPALGLTAGAAAQPPAAGDAANGKRLYEKDGCYECHGLAAQGGRDGARLAATPMSDQAFIRYVRRPLGAMPAFTQKVLSDRELTDIHAYLRSLPVAKPAKDIPLLNHLRDR